MTQKSSLTNSQRQLVDLLQAIPFGRIENLQVKNGQPSFSPAPRVVQVLKIGGTNGPRTEASLPNFALKGPVIELFRLLESVGDGQIGVIEVRHGLPQMIELEHHLDGEKP